MEASSEALRGRQELEDAECPDTYIRNFRASKPADRQISETTIPGILGAKIANVLGRGVRTCPVNGKSKTSFPA